MNKLLKLLLIRENEKVTVFYFLSFFFIVSCGMAMGKASADALFFKRFGIEYLPLMFIALAVLLTLVSLVYAAFADKISAEKFFFRLFITLVAILAATWSMIHYSENSATYPIYFLIYEAASEILLIHTALYLSQNLDTFKSKRLSPIILAGSQLGLICGGLLVAFLAPLIGASQIILVWCGLLLIAGIMISVWHKLKGPSAYFYMKRSKNSISQSLTTIKQGISFTRKSSLLRASSMAFFFLVITFYMLYYITNQVYTDYFETEESLTAFFGILTAITSLSGLLLQIFITNRAIDKIGIQKINLIFPLSISLTFFSFLLVLKLPTAIIGSFIKDALNPAFNTPARNMMFNILPKNIQGRARAVSIGIILPSALIVCAAILLTAQFIDDINYFLIPGLITSVMFLYFSFKTNSAYVKTLIQHLKEQVYLPEGALSNKTNNTLLESLENNINQSDDKLTICCAKILINSHPKQASKIIAKRLRTSSNDTADQLIKILAKHSTRPLRHCLERPDKYPAFDQHMESTLLQLLFNKKDAFARQFIKKALNSDNPRLCATGISGTIIYNSKKNIPLSNKKWLSLTTGDNNQLLASLQLVAFIEKADDDTRQQLIENYQTTFLNLLTSENLLWQTQTLEAMSNWKYDSIPSFHDLLLSLFNNTDPYLRAAVVKCSNLLDFGEYMSLLIQAFEDGHSSVRDVAMQTLLTNNSSTDTIAQQWLINNDSYTTPRAQQTMLLYLIKNGLSENILKEMAITKAQLARNYYDAMQITKNVKDKNTAYYLTYTTISERVNQTCHLLLNILQQLEQAEIISVVKAAINSADKRLIATACEAVKNLRNTDISDLLIDVLQDDFELKTNYILSFKSINEALNWCKLQDDWLHTCSSKALESS